MYIILLGIMSMNFGIVSKLVILYSEFVKYLWFIQESDWYCFNWVWFPHQTHFV